MNTFAFLPDQYLIDWFLNLQSDTGIGTLLLCILSILFSLGFGALIGYQRQINGHAAGFRTHILISLTTTLLTLISVYGLQGDQTNILILAAAGIIGVGFLGAGTIIQNGVTVKGFTTAATLFITASIGITCGLGLFSIATIVTLIVFLALTLFQKFEKRPSNKNVNILLIVSPDTPVLKDILEIANEMEINLSDLDTSLIKFNGQNVLRITFKMKIVEKDIVINFLEKVRVSVDPIELKVL